MKIIREIQVDHLARIEGKAGIEVNIGEEIEAKINVTEGPRFFEVIPRIRNMMRLSPFSLAFALSAQFPIN